MTQAARIFWNVAATYGRSLFSLVCGLFTSRWVLMCLGAEDYGLYGLVGGVIGFVAFFNSVLSLAVGRFYAFEVGKASVANDGEKALEECRAWFSTAVFLHSLLPVLLMIVGMPIGEYAVRSWLTIPPDRVSACVWVFRFSCLSCFIGMVSVPFTAMYTAKQYIAELTIYSVAATAARVILLYYMVTHPRDWLVLFGVIAMGLSVVPNLFIICRAIKVFPECRLRICEMMSWMRIRQLGSYAGWQLFGMGAWASRANGLPILINEFLGPVYNSSMTISNAIAGHANSLSSCLTGAFSPAITNARGAGDFERMKIFALRSCRIGAFLMLIFAVPVFVEAETILQFWLKTPPPGVTVLARYVLVTVLLDRLTCGHHVCVCANGNIGRYQVLTSMAIFLFLPIAWGLLKLGFGIHAIGLALVLTFVLDAVAKIYSARQLVALSIWSWIQTVFCPVLCVFVVSGFVSMVPVMFFEQSFLRVCLVCLITVISVGIMAWNFGMDNVERSFVRSAAIRRINRRKVNE